ncbi:hypothetical protein [Bradyrhizobium liaoningense]|uniref:hypothetical protein n=1 Tax=Bradyrhizobium liaoningense TaxID=43992 RepID=UPI001BAB841F|nr:hypothetical protein [Bradyrhizobium liaoningense]MBR0719518.1 hypothetical protein [Bradyrhizobium liaoningense]
MRFHAIIVLAALTGGLALAEEPKAFNPSGYPTEVQKALRYANEECTAQGGGTVSFAPDTVRRIDLTGDGRDDYVVDFHGTTCEGREAVYCGTGGCVMNILVTLPNGSVRRVFDGYVRSYEIKPRPMKAGAVRTIRFELHGGHCGGHGSPSCYKEKGITATPFEFKMP